MSMTSSAFTEHRVPSGDGEVFVRDHAGKGDAFVLMHGFPDNHHIYDALVPHLVAAGRRVVVFDFRGFGQSSRTPGATYTFDQQRDDLASVVMALGLAKIVPVAHDASGPAALNFALEHPDKVSAVCMLNSLYAAGSNIRVPELVMLFASANLDPLSYAILNDPAQFGWLLRFQQDMFRTALPEARRAAFDTTASIIIENFTGEHHAREAFRQLAAGLLPEVGKNTAQIARLSTLTVPVKLIWGEFDPYLNPGVANDLLPYLPNATLHTLPAGHWLQLDLPADVARLMLA
ncbi:Pimeloyl-ACP methyl ester carboxylesterase [Luteibacter sp. UNCMF331Sha3.1]|uniref:alpha/beta fold hydrolase n=1 Tax=Luteibacter sp. UNCMF331Sha3.1 TaxID=1502760 RepID=UPI0008D14746|nr:alpha/beta hydrolase [Luteibacter sp. UNCMF331Sha3.1]SEN10817.1 Pimeloyl-ACP methyl ester carboxylesterase [Luteibacter sp. UNCMF331Sha3.1]